MSKDEEQRKTVIPLWNLPYGLLKCLEPRPAVGEEVKHSLSRQTTELGYVFVPEETLKKTRNLWWIFISKRG